MSLVSKTNTYNETAFDKPWWKTDVRLGFDPPESLFFHIFINIFIYLFIVAILPTRHEKREK
jgi:hypothetical protein